VYPLTYNIETYKNLLINLQIIDEMTTLSLTAIDAHCCQLYNTL